MPAMGVLVKEIDWENPYTVIRWGTNRTPLVNALYLVLSLDREDRVSPFDDDYPKFPAAVTHAETLHDLAFVLSDRQFVMTADSVVALMKENEELRKRVQELRNG